MQREGNFSSPRLPRYVEVVLAVAVLLELLAPFFARTSGTDGPCQMYWIGAFSDLLQQGVWLPRWLPNGFGGLGAPSFYFYPPLAFYLASAVKFLFGVLTLNRVFQITALLATLASFGAAYLLIRNLGQSKYWSAIGAALYAFAPFRVAEIYSRSSLSSHVSFAFVPLIVLGIVWIGRERWSLRGVLLLGASSAALVLSSVPVAVAMAVMAVPVAILLWRQLSIRMISQIIVSGSLAVALSAFYLLPAAGLSQYIQASNFYREPDFFLLDLLHLRSLIELYHTGFIFLGIGVCIVVWMRARHSIGPLATISRAALGISIVILALQTPYISLPIWHHVAPLKMLQGSWRLYIPVVLASSVLLVIGRDLLAKRWTTYVILILGMGAIVATTPALLNIHLFTHFEPQADDPAEYLPRYAVAGRVASGGIQSTPPLQPNESVRRVSENAANPSYEVVLATPHAITVPQYYWPYLSFNGAHQIHSTPTATGLTSLALPAGTYTIHSELRESRVEAIGNWLSICAAAIVGLLSLVQLRPRRELQAAPLPIEEVISA